jgi:hypothetical protein
MLFLKCRYEDLPAENFTAVRVTRDVFSRSRVGGIFLGRESGSDGRSHYSSGLDADLRLFSNTSELGFSGDRYPQNLPDGAMQELAIDSIDS